MEAFGVNNHLKQVTEQYAKEDSAAISPDLHFREEGDRIVSYSLGGHASFLMVTVLCQAPEIVMTS